MSKSMKTAECAKSSRTKFMAIDYAPDLNGELRFEFETSRGTKAAIDRWADLTFGMTHDKTIGGWPEFLMDQHLIVLANARPVTIASFRAATRSESRLPIMVIVENVGEPNQTTRELSFEQYSKR